MVFVFSSFGFFLFILSWVLFVNGSFFLGNLVYRGIFMVLLVVCLMFMGFCDF